jgi:trehalose/maltose hydrolase-like predicted phosphorylase
MNRTLSTGYAFRAHAAKRYRLRQMASVVPSAMHTQPDLEAVRQVALARKRGFDAIRAANRAKWADLWRGRTRLVGAQQRWQAMADAAFFYLMSSTHVGSLRPRPIRPRNVARLPLLLWSRNVGHRDFRCSGP